MTTNNFIKTNQSKCMSIRIATSVNRLLTMLLLATTLVGTISFVGCTASTDSPEITFEKAKMFADRGKHDDAILAYTAALEAFPDRADVYYLRGVSYENLQLPEKALEDYSTCLKLDPSRSDAINNKGVVLAQLERFDEAIQEFTLLVNEFPEDALARRNRGLCLHDLGKFDEAVLDYKKAIELAPEDAQTWFQLGNVFLEQDSLQDAVTNFDKAIALDGRYAKAWMNRGVARFNMGQKQEALADLQQARTFDSNIVIPGIDWAEVGPAADVVVAAKPVMADNVPFDWSGCLAFAKQTLLEKGFTELQEASVFPEQRCGVLQGIFNGHSRQIYIGLRANENSSSVALPAIAQTDPDVVLSLLVLEIAEPQDAAVLPELLVHSFLEKWDASGDVAKPLLISVELPGE
ncbi:MAG: tetratricopeptide repeat protein [Fuerstiella sp.]